MDIRLKSALVVQACIKLADKSFLPISVIKKGHYERGIILLRIIDLENKSVFFRSTFDFENKLDWQIAGKGTPLDLDKSEEFIEKEKKIDLDLWVLEIESLGKNIDIISLFNFN